MAKPQSGGEASRQEMRLFGSSFTPTGALTFGGLVLMYVSGAALIALILISYYRRDISPANLDFSQKAVVINFYFTAYSAQLLLLLTALLAAGIGYGLLRAAGTATKDTIPVKDYELIKEMLLTNNQQGIADYVKLSSLSGMVGAFTKLGLPGLPLATIALTLFFAIVAMITQGSEISPSLFDLAKLTLGAFIGSYVQKSSSEVSRMVVDAQRLNAANGRGPGAESQGQPPAQPSAGEPASGEQPSGLETGAKSVGASAAGVEENVQPEAISLVDRAG